MGMYQNAPNVTRKLQYATVNHNLHGHMPTTDMLSLINNCKETVLQLKQMTGIFHNY